MSNEQARNWEKCARLFLLNSPSHLTDLSQILEQMLNNIVENNGDEKYLVVKLTNKNINARVVARSGGVEFLLAAGFAAQTDPQGNKILKYMTVSSAQNWVESLSLALQWLRNTVTSCLDLHGSKQADSACCECVLQLRLPTGVSVYGGFMRGDTLHDVSDYAACYFRADR